MISNELCAASLCMLVYANDATPFEQSLTSDESALSCRSSSRKLNIDHFPISTVVYTGTRRQIDSQKSCTLRYLIVLHRGRSSQQSSGAYHKVGSSKLKCGYQAVDVRGIT
jgi:hypothetical protein